MRRQEAIFKRGYFQSPAVKPLLRGKRHQAKLAGVLNRPAGSVAGFRYSRAMKNAKIVWDEKTLDAYLAEPQRVVPGNLMPFSGIADPRTRADLIVYLKTRQF